MPTTPEVFTKARAILNLHRPPSGDYSAWMSKQAFLELGGTQEQWDLIKGEDEAKLIRSKP